MRGGNLTTEITINGGPSPTTNYLGWVPVPAQIRLTGPAATGPVTVTLRNKTPAAGGRVVFLPEANLQAASTLQLRLPANGTPVSFLVAGRFQQPSKEDGDAAIEVIDSATRKRSSITRLMVRVRKDATKLTTGERDRFLAAIATLNDRGMGKFSDFRNVHSEAGIAEAHGNAGFLPWHRAFILDLERELQRIDPSVALPYWRFDRPARKLFTRSFFGVAEAATGTVLFGSDNPLQFWATDGVPGIVRGPGFNARTQAPALVIDEANTLLRGGPAASYQAFRHMEGNPHGTAHVSFSGFISELATAARDPLFFLLHANVDRLWAKW